MCISTAFKNKYLQMSLFGLLAPQVPSAQLNPEQMRTRLLKK